MNKKKDVHFTDKQFEENAKKAAAEMKRLAKEHGKNTPDIAPIRDF